MKPPPPTGLVNRSGSSLSSTSPSSRSANSCRRWLRGTCPGFSCPVCLAAREDAASTLLARMTPNSGGGSSIAALPDAKLSDPVGELLRLATSGSPTEANTLGSTSALATKARCPSIAKYLLAKRKWRASGRRMSGSRLPAAIIDACTAMAARFARRGNDGSMNTVWPSVHGGPPGCCAATAKGRPANADASMPRVCNRSASAPSATDHLRNPEPC